MTIELPGASLEGASPYQIYGPALISFSGGRTSGFMLKQILDAHGGALPENVRAVFANTGKEMPETLDFVRECGDQWRVPIAWVEYRIADDGRSTFDVVNHNSASRNGEPYKALIDKKGYLPNPVTRFCTIELKIRVMRDFARSLGWDHWTNIIGLRADEPARVAKTRARSGVERWENSVPLADAGVSSSDVSKFWARQPFDLRLPNINGSTPLGNCDLCFLKGAATIAGIIRERPDLARWWIEAEAKARASKPSGAVFRSDRPKYAKILELSQIQGDFFAGADNSTQPCMCHD